jgi:hypothetical protein
MIKIAALLAALLTLQGCAALAVGSCAIHNTRSCRS